MNCPSCGTTYPDGAKFCPSCGFSLPKEKNNKLVVEVVSKPISWENCEIEFSGPYKVGVFNSMFQFVAKAIGPEGQYNAAVVDFQMGGGLIVGVEHYPRGSGAETAHHDIVDILVKDGWESTGRSRDWFSHTFKRRLE